MKRSPEMPLVLDRVDGSGEETGSWVVNNATCMQITERSAIFRANLLQSAEGEPLDVVLKFDPTSLREEDFLREAGAYGTGAKVLQGTVIPVYYGCFSANVNRRWVTCLVLHYAGEPMKTAFQYADWDFK